MLRTTRVFGLTESPAFVKGILDRITAYLAFSKEGGFETLDLYTIGRIPVGLLDLELHVVRIGKNESVVARVYTARTADGACRLFLNDWKVFINSDPHEPHLDAGVHLWMGVAWRHLPHASTSLY